MPLSGTITSADPILVSTFPGNYLPIYCYIEMGGFRRNLLVVSWVTPTPGCTAKFNFQANRYSQPLILRPFGRSGRELPVEYLGIRSNHFSSIFRCLQLKKAVDRGQHMGIVGILGSLVKERFHSDSTNSKIIGKSHRKNQLFMRLRPGCFCIL
jgi:hypothetical protein